MEENKIFRSTEIAADKTLEPVWDPNVPFPSHEEMKEPKVFTTVKVTEAKEGGYYYLHEATIAFHKGKFFAGWANHKTRETGDWKKPWRKNPFRKEHLRGSGERLKRKSGQRAENASRIASYAGLRVPSQRVMPHAVSHGQSDAPQLKQVGLSRQQKMTAPARCSFRRSMGSRRR